MNAKSAPSDYVPRANDHLVSRLDYVSLQIDHLGIESLYDAIKRGVEPGNSWNRLSVGFWHEKAGDIQAAIRHYQDLWEQETTKDLGSASQTAMQLAECLVSVGRRDEAIQCGDTMLRQLSSDPGLWMHRWLWSKFFRDFSPEKTLKILETLVKEDAKRIPKKLLKQLKIEIEYWRQHLSGNTGM